MFGDFGVLLSDLRVDVVSPHDHLSFISFRWAKSLPRRTRGYFPKVLPFVKVAPGRRLFLKFLTLLSNYFNRTSMVH